MALSPELTKRINELRKEATELKGRAETGEQILSANLKAQSFRPEFAALAVANALASKDGRYKAIQADNISNCPADSVAALKDPNFVVYPKASGEMLFHRGSIGFLGKQKNNQAECVYGERGNLEVGWHEGTVNEYSSESNPIRHTFTDAGGIVSMNGLRGFLSSLPELTKEAYSELRTTFSRFTSQKK